MGMPIPFFAAFVAGLLSIASPCVLPLVPLYLTHLAGVSVDGSGAVTPARGRVLVNATAYVLGFSTVFVLLGVALGAAGSLVATASVVAGGSPWLIRFGGALLASWVCRSSDSCGSLGSIESGGLAPVAYRSGTSAPRF